MKTLPPTMLCTNCGDELPRIEMPNGICPGCLEINPGL